MTSLRVSVVIPTRNEAADLAGTLAAIAALDPPVAETLVVDHSQDATAEVAARYAPTVRLMPQTGGGGRAGARNQGILATSGDVVIVLNADVRLPRDFVAQILPHYEAGADYVLVESRVSNLESLYAQYAQAVHAEDYRSDPEVDARMQWTEGFSCRRGAALAVGLFPEGRTHPLVGGEDGWFGDRLHEAGYRKVFDRRVVVHHVAPATFASFWRQRVERGCAWPQILRDRFGWSDRRIAVVGVKIALWHLVKLALLVPSATRGWRLSAHSPRRRRDWVAMAALHWLDTLAMTRGYFDGMRP